MHVPCSNSLFALLYVIYLVSQLSRTQGSSLGYWSKKNVEGTQDANNGKDV